MTRALLSSLLAFALAVGGVAVARGKPKTARAKPATRGLKTMPRPLGLRFGLAIGAVERLLVKRKAQQRLRLVRTIEPTGRRVEHGKLSARLPRGPFRKLKLLFFGGRLVRIKLYGETMPAWVARHSGRAHAVVAASRYWVDPARLCGMRCEARRCELFDLKPMIGRGITRAEARAQYQRFLARAR
ncbi:MAG: hypothetical protein CSB49_03640 [Proteobacteria bacterium]|nr:MAG: hypothetical protein CSB49_03640 [Pseudomonadota bacterium]